MRLCNRFALWPWTYTLDFVLVHRPFLMRGISRMSLSTFMAAIQELTVNK